MIFISISLLMKIIITSLQYNSLISESLMDSSFEISYEKNPEVEKIQKELINKNYYIGKFGNDKDGADGKYGPFTKAAHEAYKKGIPPEEFNSKREEFTQKYIPKPSQQTLENEFNFHVIPDGKNNYRSAQIPVKLDGKEYLSSIIDKYGIKKIIRFNGDGRDGRHRSSHPVTNIKDEEKLAKSKGVEFYKLSATRDQDKVNTLLSGGNVLIHCAHGADRTGGNVGGYLFDINWGDTKKIWDYTTKYNSWRSMVKNNPKTFVSGGYLRQAQKFGVKDLEHAKRLTNNERKLKK
mgnify:CR=1 FL=1